MELDQKDKAILRELDKDVRASLTQLGKRTRLSKEVVAYRIKRLEEKDILTGYWAIPDIDATHKPYKLLLKNKSLGNKKESLINYLIKQKEIGWLALTEGNWDIVCTLFVTNDIDCSKLLKNIFLQWGSHFKEKQILKSTGMLTTNEKYLQPNNELLYVEQTDFLKPEKKKDDIDRKIINILSNNSRITFTELSKELGITPEAISYRYRKLIKNKEIAALKPRINHAKLGLSYYHLFIAISNFKQLEAINSYYTQHANCVFIMHHVGYYDLHLELVMREEETQAFIDELTEQFGNDIASYELLKISKEFLLDMTK